MVAVPEQESAEMKTNEKTEQRRGVFIEPARLRVESM
jgi:hypothetical protein